MDWLAKIPGPDFLGMYLVISLVCIVLGRVLVRGRQADSLLPDKNQLDPIAFAVLRGGWKAAIDTAVMQLMERDVIGFQEKDGQKVMIIKTRTEDLTPIQQVVYNGILYPQTSIQFKTQNLKEPAEQALQPTYRQLEKYSLLKSPQELRKAKQIAFFLIFFLDGLAFVKICLGVVYNKPFLFLLLLAIVVTIVMWLVIKPGERMTPLGKRYIGEITSHYSWLRSSSPDQWDSGNAALGMAIFGIGILAYYELFGDYQAFAQGELSRNGSWGNGNSGSDSGSGGCGGDSGGGCGGGSGCGGCGGGGD